jgi:hypothetical protein
MLPDSEKYGDWLYSLLFHLHNYYLYHFMAPYIDICYVIFRLFLK